jgi:hypothetical protein
LSDTARKAREGLTEVFIAEPCLLGCSYNANLVYWIEVTSKQNNGEPCFFCSSDVTANLVYYLIFCFSANRVDGWEAFMLFLREPLLLGAKVCSIEKNTVRIVFNECFGHQQNHGSSSWRPA